MHTLLDLRGPIPSFIHVSVGKMGDARALDMIAPEAGSIYVMDRGYVDFRRLNVFHRAGAFFVTRAKRNMNYHRVYSRAVDKTTGVRADQSVALNGFYTRKDYPQHMRRISFCDPETGKRLVFLTNNFVLPAETIAALYKKRWQVDIDQAWRLSRFCGRGGGAVGEPRRRAAPMRRRRADRLQRGDRLGVGAHQLGTFRAAANVSTG